MLKRAAIAFAALMLLQGPIVTAHAAQVEARQENLAGSLDAWLAAQFKADAPGVTVIAARDGKTVFRKAYGMADLATKRPLTPDAALRIGSITKQFTAVGILMLADEGKLALSDDITRFFPDYPTGGKKLTVEHLLTHTSGIVSYTGKREFGSLMETEVSVGKAIDFFKNDPLEFAPASRFAYNNSGYFLLGAIIEKVSGQPYARFVDERIAKPLGMKRTGYEGKSAGLKPVAGYSYRDGSFHPGAALSMDWPYASGALLSSVDDLARWQQGLASGKLLRPGSLEQAFKAYTLSDGKPGPYGYGWFVGKLDGSPMLFHGGDINGFHAEALWLPKERIYVAMLSNAERGSLPDLEKLARKLALTVAGKAVPAPTGVPDPATLGGYVGVYPIDERTSHTVRVEKGALTIQGTGMPRAPLQPYKTDGFLIGDSMMRVDFSRDAKGVVGGMTITDDYGAKVHRRAQTSVTERPTVHLAPALLDQYLGRYALAPGFDMEVKRAGETLRIGPVGHPGIEAAALADNVFYAPDNDAELRFEKQADGRMALFFSQGETSLNGPRQP